MQQLLYKYLPPERVSFFSSFNLRFTQPAALNDPYECLPCIKQIDHASIQRALRLQIHDYINDCSAEHLSRKARREGARKLAKHLSHQMRPLYEGEDNNLFITDLFTTIYDKIRLSRICFLSLTVRADSQLMWAHYARNHKGFVLGMDSNHDFFQKTCDERFDGIPELQKVIYSEKRVPVLFADNKIPHATFFTKHSDWAYEEEMRLLKAVEDASEVIKETDSNIYLFNIPKSSLSRVIFGSRCPSSVQAQIRSLIAQDSELSHVRLYRSFLHPYNFSIVIQEESAEQGAAANP
jgi:hypothetical protein